MFEHIQKFNDNLKDLIEVMRDFNTIAGGVVGYKVKYEKKLKNKKGNLKNE